MQRRLSGEDSAAGPAAEAARNAIPPQSSPLVDASISDRVKLLVDEAIAASAFCRVAFGDLLVDTVTELGRQEVARFAANVTDWELDRYRDLD